jgi:hypothetical protein
MKRKSGSKIRVIFRDKDGRFIPQSDRYTKRVAKIQVVRNRKVRDIASGPLSSKDLAQVLSQREFESLTEATKLVKTFSSKKKYKAWDIASQIDKTKGLRRQNLKLTVMVNDGGRQKKFTFYHNIKRNSKSNYQIFRRINQEIGLEGMFLYDRVGGKFLSDRTGKKVSLLGIKVEKVV